jgi:hypothetical protein
MQNKGTRGQVTKKGNFFRMGMGNPGESEPVGVMALATQAWPQDMN